MSDLKKNRDQQQTGLGVAVKQISTMITEEGSEFTDAGTVQDLVSLESLNESGSAELAGRYAQAEVSVKSVLESTLSVSEESISEAGLEAATVVALAAGNPQAYHEQAVSVESANLIEVAQGSAGTIDSRSQVSLEAFDESSLSGRIAYSVMYNALAATQDRFCEAFFPTVVETPDKAGFSMTVTRAMVMNEVKHSLSGDPVNFEKKSLIDAMVDHTILKNNANKVVPVLAADDSNADYFVPASLFNPKMVPINGVDVRTAPLKFGKEIDLIGISMGGGEVVGQTADQTDSLDPQIALEAVYLHITNKAGDVNELVRMDVSNFTRTNFTQDLDGDYGSREMTLNFATSGLALKAGLKTTAGADSVLLAPLTTHTVNYKLRVSGDVDVETGTIVLDAGAADVSSVIDANGDEVTKATLSTELEDIIVTAVGYDAEATRSNANMRLAGKYAETNTITEGYKIPLGAPFSALTPTSTDNSASDLKTLVAMARTQNSNNAITALFNRIEAIENAAGTPMLAGQLPNIQGVGRYLVKPFFERIALDVKARINSEKTHEKREDLSALLVDTIRDVVYRMIEDSNYEAALQLEAMGTNERPRVIIGTDKVIEQHLIVSGDERSLSVGVDHDIVTTVDDRLDGKIVISLSRGKKGEADALSFGTHAYIPELTSVATIHKQGATVKRTQVQPRNLYVGHLPIVAVIEVSNITELLREKVAG